MTRRGGRIGSQILSSGKGSHTRNIRTVEIHIYTCLQPFTVKDRRQSAPQPAPNVGDSPDQRLHLATPGLRGRGGGGRRQKKKDWTNQKRPDCLCPLQPSKVGPGAGRSGAGLQDSCQCSGSQREPSHGRSPPREPPRLQVELLAPEGAEAPPTPSSATEKKNSSALPFPQ